MRYRVWLVAAVLVLLAVGPPLSVIAAGDEPRNADPVLGFWLDTLIAGLSQDHERVRKSAADALVGIGEPAVPRLKALAASSEPELSVVARAVLTRIGIDAIELRSATDATTRNSPSTSATIARRVAADMGIDDERIERVARRVDDAEAERQQLFRDLRSGEIDNADFKQGLEQLTSQVRSDLREFLTEQEIDGILQRSGFGTGTAD